MLSSGCSASGNPTPLAEKGGTSTAPTGGNGPSGIGGITATGGSTSTIGGTTSLSGGTTSLSGGTTSLSGGTTSLTGGTSSTGGVKTGGGTTGGAATGGSAIGGTTSTTGGVNTGGGSTTGGWPTLGGFSTGGTRPATGGTAATGGKEYAGGWPGNVGGGFQSGGYRSGGTGPTGGAPIYGGSPARGGTAGGPTPGEWHGCKVSISDATLNTEYTGWKSAFVMDCGDGRARVQAGGKSSPSNETFSEGIGYGMLLAVSFNDQATFDKLWAYYKSNRNANGLMNWKMNACSTEVWGQNGASDGDLDTAMALVMADRRWGGYTTDTNALLDAIHTYETVQCGSTLVLRSGDAWGDCTGNNINPSYFSPGYYRAFALYQGSDSAKAQFWNKLADDTINLLLTYQSTFQAAWAGTPARPLVPEWGSAAGAIVNTDYGYNACRTPWRVAVDYAWWGTPGAQTFDTAVSAWLDAVGGVAANPYDKNSAFLGAFASTGIATGKCDAYYQSWMNANKDDSPYFQATLRVLCMITMAGKFVY